MKTEKFDAKKHLEALRETLELSQSGYAGVNRNGQIVDRRNNPEAVPIQANSIFNTPAPLPVEGGEFNCDLI